MLKYAIIKLYEKDGENNMLIFHDADKSSEEVSSGDDFLTVPDGYYIDNQNLNKNYLFVTDSIGNVYVTTYDQYDYMHSLYNGDLRYVRKIKSLITDNVTIDLKHSKSYIKNDDEDSESLSHYNIIVVISHGYNDTLSWTSLLNMVENDELPKNLQLVAHENHYHNFNEFMIQDDVTKEAKPDGDGTGIISYTYPAERLYIGNPKDYSEIDTNKVEPGGDGTNYQFSIDEDGYLTIPPLTVTSAIPNPGEGQNMIFISIWKEGKDDDD